MTAQLQTIGRYHLIERIGSGRMGVLYRGIDPLLDREVAIKVMSTDFDSVENGDEARARFFSEAQAAATLTHRNIVPIFEFTQDGDTPYIVTQFLRGSTLAARLQTGPPLSLEQKLDIMSEVCSGLQFAHERDIVHRDVRPENIWLLDDATVKVVDFGIAKLFSSTLVHADVLCHTNYMAPEQVLGGAVDGRADVFSAAVVLYELVSGRRPFAADSPTATLLNVVRAQPEPLNTLVPGLPTALLAAIAKGLQKDAADRYRSAGDFAADLHLLRLTSVGDVAPAREQENQPDRQPVAAAPPIETTAARRTTTTLLDRLMGTVLASRLRQSPIVWLIATLTVIVLGAAIAWLGRASAAGR